MASAYGTNMTRSEHTLHDPSEHTLHDPSGHAVHDPSEPASGPG